jgi:hypothetical protein
MSPRHAGGCARTVGLRLAVLALALLHGMPTLAASPPPRRMEDLCRPAVMAAEIDAELPQGLLLAIARVESGRRDPASGSTIPWPWTINAEGVPMIFETRKDAVAAVERLRSQNIQSIDVGCMQVNLYHHPNAFNSLEEAFDPASNARYAAHFLRRLRDSAGDMDIAVGRYHSSTPGLSEAYRARVLSAWSGTSRRSPLDLQRERLAAAWVGNRMLEGWSRPTDTAGQLRSRASRDAVEQAAVLWQQTRQGRSANWSPPESPGRGRRPLLQAWPSSFRNMRLSMR